MRPTFILFFKPSFVQRTWNTLFDNSFNRIFSKIDRYPNFNKIVEKCVLGKDTYYGEMLCSKREFSFHLMVSPPLLKLRIQILKQLYL